MVDDPWNFSDDPYADPFGFDEYGLGYPDGWSDDGFGDFSDDFSDDYSDDYEDDYLADPESGNEDGMDDTEDWEGDGDIPDPDSPSPSQPQGNTADPWNNPAGAGPPIPDLGLSPQDIETLQKQWKAEQLKDLATNDALKQQSFQDWIKENMGPALDLLPKKGDGSPDWPSFSGKVLDWSGVQEAQANWSKDPSNQNQPFDMEVVPIGNTGLYFLYKYKVQIQIQKGF